MLLLRLLLGSFPGRGDQLPPLAADYYVTAIMLACKHLFVSTSHVSLLNPKEKARTEVRATVSSKRGTGISYHTYLDTTLNRGCHAKSTVSQ